MSILSDREIRRYVRDGKIRIDPWDEGQLNPASYDLTLGDEYAVYTQNVLDVRRENTIAKGLIEDGFTVEPGHCYLMHTRERIWTERFVPVIDGKSSLGRLFLQIHVTAGFGDPGYAGQYTLEVVAHRPLRIYPGMRIAQVRFHTLSSPVERVYQGNYIEKEHSTGPVPSRAHHQFQQKEPKE